MRYDFEARQNKVEWHKTKNILYYQYLKGGKICLLLIEQELSGVQAVVQLHLHLLLHLPHLLSVDHLEVSNLNHTGLLYKSLANLPIYYSF